MAAKVLWIACVLGQMASVVGMAAEVNADYPYYKREAMIPMRDGVKLYTQIYVPKDDATAHPILLQRTPYAVGYYKPEELREVVGPSVEFMNQQYIVAYQEVRGKERSEGTFFHHPPYVPNKKRRQADESSDAYDTIEWLIKNVPHNNGRVGMWGISAAGFTTYMGLLDPHPALRAASPQGGPGVEFMGDDYRHYGAFRPMIAFDWTWRFGIEGVHRDGFDYGTPDGYQFFLELGPMANVNRKHFKGENGAWNEYIDHPDYDQFWRDRDVSRHIHSSKVPVLTVIGWFDQDDYYGPWKIFKQLEDGPSRAANFLAVGPWAHGDWRRTAGERLGDMEFGSKTSEHFHKDIELAFFDYFLKGQGAPPSRITTFETGRNRWHQLAQWPPQGTTRRLYLRPRGALSFDPPRETEAFDEYTSDPARPVPWSEEIRTNHGLEWIVADQRFTARRSDVLVYSSEPLDADVTIAGSIMANVYFSTTGTDADVIVKLIDVYPGDAPDPTPNPRNVKMGGYQMLLAGEVFRARYLKSFSVPQPLAPGAVNALSFDLLDKFHTFKKGHRIMIQIQSSWFPIVDRNPQKFVPNIAFASDDDFQKASIRIHRSATQATNVEVNVVPGLQ